MATTAKSMKGPADSTLSAEQWQALGRLADRYQRVETAGEFISREFGGTLTANTLALAEIVQDQQLLNTLREVTQTLNVLAETGMLERLREFLRFAAESESYLDTDKVVAEFIQGTGRLPVAQISAAWKGGESAPPSEAPAGGWKGLLHLMRDPEVQHGIFALSRFVSRLHRAGEQK